MVPNIDESGENLQQRTPNLEGWTKLHKTEQVWKERKRISKLYHVWKNKNIQYNHGVFIPRIASLAIFQQDCVVILDI